MVIRGLLDRWTDQWTDRQIDGWTDGWTICLSPTDLINTSKNDDFPTDFAILTNALPLGPTNGLMDRPMDGHTLL